MRRVKRTRVIQIALATVYHLGRRSGRIPALPYPPTQALTILRFHDFDSRAARVSPRIGCSSLAPWG